MDAVEYPSRHTAKSTNVLGVRRTFHDEGPAPDKYLPGRKVDEEAK